MITLATYTLNFLHPGFLLGDGRTWKQMRAQAAPAKTGHFENESNATFTPDVEAAAAAQEPKASKETS